MYMYFTKETYVSNNVKTKSRNKQIKIYCKYT